MRVEHKLVWGEENAGITQFLVELVILKIKPAEGALDAFCPGRVVASWHELATATPSASGIALFIFLTFYLLLLTHGQSQRRSCQATEAGSCLRGNSCKDARPLFS